MNSAFKKMIRESHIKERKEQMLRAFVKTTEEMLNEIKNNISIADFEDILMSAYCISEKMADKTSVIISNAEFEIKDIVMKKVEEFLAKSKGEEEKSTC